MNGVDYLTAFNAIDLIVKFNLPDSSFYHKSYLVEKLVLGSLVETL